jgi:hypothetical protein
MLLATSDNAVEKARQFDCMGGDEVHMPNDTQPIFCRACGKIATINARSFETRAAVGWLVIDVTTPEGPTKDCYCPEHKGSVLALLRRRRIIRY